MNILIGFVSRLVRCLLHKKLSPAKKKDPAVRVRLYVFVCYVPRMWCNVLNHCMPRFSLFRAYKPCHYNRKFASCEASPPLRGYNFRFPLHRLITQLISPEIEFPLINCVIIRCLYAKNPSASLRTITTDVTSTVNSLQAASRHMKAST